MPKRRRWLRLVAAVSAVPLVAGCFGAAGQSTEDGRMSVVMLLPPRAALNPFTDDAFKLSRLGIAETLINLDPDGGALPGLAVSWERLDAFEWSFELRRGVVFHDGSPLTADAVVDSLSRATRAQPKPRILDGVDVQVRADGPDRVVVRTAEADPLVPQRLSSPQLSILAPSAYGPDGIPDPIRAGSGPFVLTELRGAEGARLDRYDGYWNGKAQAVGLDVHFVPDGTARTAALRTGDADVVEAVPASQAGLLDPGVVRAVPMPRTNTLYLNTRPGSALNDPGLRSAVREAVDRRPLVDGPYEGQADLAEGLLGPALPWSDQRPEPAAPAAPADPAGREITLATFSDRAELPEVAAILEQQLEHAGFQVELVVREYSQIEADALSGQFDAFILSRATVLDSGDPVAYLQSDFSCDGGFNLSGLCDPGVDTALAEAAAEGDLPVRREKILRAEREVLRTGAAVPLLHERVFQGNAPGVEGAAFDPRERLLILPGTRAN